MKKNEKTENATNDNVDLQADTLSDLPVIDDQADETKGGTRGGTIKLYCAPGDPS